MASVLSYVLGTVDKGRPTLEREGEFEMLCENEHKGGGLVQRNERPLFRVLQIIVKLYILKNLGMGREE